MSHSSSCWIGQGLLGGKTLNRLRASVAVAAALTAMLMPSCDALAQSSHPDNGVVNGRRYLNGYFGFSYRFPEGWKGHAVTRSASLNQAALSATRFYALFAANPLVPGAGETRYISIQADDLSHNPSVRTGKDFLAVSLPSLVGQAGAYDPLRQQRVNYAGKTFYRQDLQSKRGAGSPLYQTQLVTVEHGYALTFSFIASNQDDLEELVRSAESLSVFKPGSELVVSTEANEPTKQQPAAAPQPPSAEQVAPSLTVSAEPATQIPQEQVMVVKVKTLTPSPAAPRQTQNPPQNRNEVRSSPPVIMVHAPDEKEAATAAAPTSAKPLAVTPPAVKAEAPKPVRTPEPVAVSVPDATPATLKIPDAHEESSSPVATQLADPQKPVPQQIRPARVVTVKITESAAEPARPLRTPAVPLTQPQTPAAEKPIVSSALMQPLYGAINRSPAPVANAAPASAPPATSSRGISTPVTTFSLVATPAAPQTTSYSTVASAAPPPSIPSVAVPPSRIRISAVSFASCIERKVAVAYPAMAKAQRVQGEVVLSVVVGGDGKLREVAVMRGPELLRQSAVDGVKQWRFKPYLVDGQPVEVESQISMNFKLAE